MNECYDADVSEPQQPSPCALPREVFLPPGGFHFGGGAVRLRTILGSCVAITLWHPEKRVGGMCHYLLPQRKQRGDELNGLYAEEAVELFLREVFRSGSRPADFEVLLVGGGQMFPVVPFNVAGSNVAAGRELLRTHGFSIVAEHVGGAGHRQVIMELWSGRVVVRQHALTAGGG